MLTRRDSVKNWVRLAENWTRKLPINFGLSAVENSWDLLLKDSLRSPRKASDTALTWQGREGGVKRNWVRSRSLIWKETSSSKETYWLRSLLNECISCLYWPSTGPNSFTWSLSHWSTCCDHTTLALLMIAFFCSSDQPSTSLSCLTASLWKKSSFTYYAFTRVKVCEWKLKVEEGEKQEIACEQRIEDTGISLPFRSFLAECDDCKSHYSSPLNFLQFLLV